MKHYLRNTPKPTKENVIKFTGKATVKHKVKISSVSCTFKNYTGILINEDLRKVFKNGAKSRTD